MKSTKQKYQAFCATNKNIPLFLTHDWYQHLYGDDWDVVLVEKNGNVLGFLPHILTRKKTFTIIRPPMLTPYQGVWINYPEDQKYTNRLSFEKEVMEAIIQALPEVDDFQQKFLPEFTNWLPFYWEGFTQSTRYTYIINDLSDLDAVYSEFRENIRREIKKAEKELVVESITEIELLYRLKKEVYQNNQEKYPIPEALIKRAYHFVKANSCGELLAAKDAAGNIHSVLFYVWDHHSAYYLHGGTAVEYKTGGSMSLLLWEAIQRSSKHSRRFNFEGSMIASIERYFRAFGGQQTPYFEISRTNSKLLKLLKH